jgi:hypothetical protein
MWLRGAGGGFWLRLLWWATVTQSIISLLLVLAPAVVFLNPDGCESWIVV